MIYVKTFNLFVDETEPPISVKNVYVYEIMACLLLINDHYLDIKKCPSYKFGYWIMQNVPSILWPLTPIEISSILKQKGLVLIDPFIHKDNF